MNIITETINYNNLEYTIELENNTDYKLIFLISENNLEGIESTILDTDDKQLYIFFHIDRYINNIYSTGICDICLFYSDNWKKINIDGNTEYINKLNIYNPTLEIMQSIVNNLKLKINNKDILFEIDTFDVSE